MVSQLDITPTILGLTGLTPRLSPFAGRDVTCALVTDCVSDRAAYLSEVYEPGAGLVDREGFWFYGFARHTLDHIDLALAGPPRRLTADEPAAGPRIERILALYVAANMLIEQNTIWSWRDFGDRL
jgi:hypothetical protein